MSSRELIESYVAAWKARDPERIVGHFADDGVRRWEFVVPPIVGGPTVFRGPEEIIVPIQGLLGSMPDLTTEILTLVETDEGAMLEFRHEGTHTVAWEKWAPQGEPVEFSGVCAYRVTDDKLAEERIYMDPDLLIREWVPPLGTLMGVGVGMWRHGRETKRARKAEPAR